MDLTIVDGELLYQDTEAIVNPWHRNTPPWNWFPLHRVSRTIQQYGGRQPFHELQQRGAIPPGGAVSTSAGTLPYKAIVHVAVRELWPTSGLLSQAVQHALALAEQQSLRSIAFPVVGIGAAGLNRKAAEQTLLETCARLDPALVVVIVRLL